MKNDVIIVRGGGDLATGVIQKLFRSGFHVLVLEVEKPTTIRRTVSLSEAVYEGATTVEDLLAILVHTPDEIAQAWKDGRIPVLIDPNAEILNTIRPLAVIDAILAKKNLGTNKMMAPITIALGPGFCAGMDVDVVIETMRGHNLGKLIFSGFALTNTGVPGEIHGISKERVLYSPCKGKVNNKKNIGELVVVGEVITCVDQMEVTSSISGILRGIIKDGLWVYQGLKIADVDPRLNELENCFTISDKARTIGGAVLEAIMYLKRRNISG